jgi:gliding motility-associated lipoprotein GldH
MNKLVNRNIAKRFFLIKLHSPFFKTQTYFTGILLPFFFACCVLTSCDRSQVMEKNEQIKDYKWDYIDSKIFNAEITDTVQHYNLYVNVRHSFQFDWRNVWIKIQTVFPDGKSFERRVNLVLSEPDGHWFGDCLGDNCDLQIPIQQNAIFPEKGKYTFKVSQDMRVNPLSALKSIGMRLEKAKNQ